MRLRARLARAGWAVCALTVIAHAGRADRIAYQGRLVVGARGIVVMNDDGARPVEMPRVPGGDSMTPALSPDGAQLAFSAKSEGHYRLWTVALAPDNTAVGEPRQLTNGESDDEQPAWAPDGQRIAYVSATGDDRGLFVMPAAGGAATRITPLERDFRNACPHWSPDGASIVFSSEGKLFIVSATGGERREICADGMYPSWSPEGKEVAFFARKPQAALMAISPATGETRVLLKGIEFFGATAWSPDGAYIAFKADKVGGTEGSLWRAPAAGGAATPLRSYGVAHGYLDWSRGPATTVAAVPPSAPPPPRIRLVQPQPIKPARSSENRATRMPSGGGPVVVAPTQVGGPAKRAEAPPQSGPVRIVSPAADGVVRGTVRVRVTKSDPGGYVSFFVDDHFVSATIAPFEMAWDTRAYGEGPHVLAVTGYGATGDLQGSVEARLTVRNNISAELVPSEGILPRYRFKAGEKRSYTVTVQARVGAGETPLPAVAEQIGTIEAALTQRVTEVKRVRTGGETATRGAISSELTRGTMTVNGAFSALPEVGGTWRSFATSDGVMTPLADGAERLIALGNLAMRFPAEPVKVGDRWSGPLTLLPTLLSAVVARVPAEHTVAGLEWQGGYEAMRIVSTFAADSLPVNVGSLALEEVSGTRTTWFAYKEHMIVRIEDQVRGVFNQAQAASFAAAGAPPSSPVVHYDLKLTQALSK